MGLGSNVGEPTNRPAVRTRYKVLPLALIPVLLASLHGIGTGGEGYRHVPYRDSNGRWTVCGGLAGPDVDPKHVYSDDECKQRETAFAVELGRQMGSCLREPLSWSEWFAWMHFGWNTGGRGFCSAYAVTLLNEGHHVEACEAMSHFHSSGGHDCRIRSSGCYGVWTRRLWEISICKSGAW